MAAARTDCIAGLPDRVATLLAGLLPVKIVPAAFPLPSTLVVLVWHERTHADPGARCFRDLIVSSVGDPRLVAPNHDRRGRKRHPRGILRRRS